ncbi:MAG: hypothetical protein OGMRLDGQ_002120 [Candidatus Fervidibacter sp.]
MRWWLFFVLLSFASVAGAWHGRLACDGGGYWRTRAVVIVENPSDKPQIGAPVTLRIGKSLPDLPFANKEAKAIRVCDERGRELKFDLRTPQGEVRRTGFLQAGDLLSFLAEVPAKGVARYFVYADNPKAWVVPDYLKTGLTNGSFEAGDKDPTDWERVEEDAQHRLFWVEGVARTGKRSVQTVVSEGAQPTWVKFHQTHIPLVPGMTYRFRGWVKAEKVKGFAGWFIHVFGEKGAEETPKLVSLLMARNEYEPIQIALRSDRKIQQVRVEVTPPKNQHGQTLPQPQIYRVGFVPIDHPSGYYTSQLPPWYRHVPKGFGGSDGWAGEWADPLMPFKPFDLQPNRTEAIWLVLYVPLDAQPGQYEGQVRVIAENQTISLPLRVEVVPLTLPEETELKVIFDLRGAIVGRLLAEPERLKAWYRFLASFRISPGFVLPEPTFRYENGKVTMEASGFDEMAKLLIDELKVSVLYTPSFTYAFGWAYPPKRFFNLEPFTEEYNRAYQELLRVFYDHLRQRGWSGKFVYYISDEPHFWNENIRKQMKQLCSLAHQAVPGIRIYSSTWQFVPEWVGDLDIWGIGPHGSCSVADMERLKSAGAELWFTTDGHMCIDTPYLAIERLLPYLCFAYGVSGYEFWGVSWWTYDPWEYGWHSYIRQSDEGERFYWIRYPNGDGYLVYPGDKFGLVEPLPSIRLMQVREGIEDYLLLRAIERALKEGKWQGEKAEAAKRILERARSLVSIPNEGGLRSTSLLPDPNKVTELRDDALKLWR